MRDLQDANDLVRLRHDGTRVDHVELRATGDLGLTGLAGVGGTDRRAQARVVEQLLELGAGLTDFLALEVEDAHEDIGEAGGEQRLGVDADRIATDGHVAHRLGDGCFEVFVGFCLQRL